MLWFSNALRVGFWLNRVGGSLCLCSNYGPVKHLQPIKASESMALQTAAPRSCPRSASIAFALKWKESVNARDRRSSFHQAFVSLEDAFVSLWNCIDLFFWSSVVCGEQRGLVLSFGWQSRPTSQNLIWKEDWFKSATTTYPTATISSASRYLPFRCSYSSVMWKHR